MKKVHWYDYITINLFWLGLNIRNNSIGVIFMPYLVALFAPPDYKNTFLGEMNTAGLIIAMLVQPAVGILSDRSTSRFGRRRPFIFWGVLLDLVFLVMIAASGNYWFLLVAILLQQFSANISHGALQGLIPDLVPENQRGMASAVKSILELVPLIILPLTIAWMVSSGLYWWAVVATGVGFVIPMLLTIFLVKEEPLREKPDIPLGPPMVRVLLMLLGIILGAAVGLAGGGAVGGLSWLVSKPVWGGSLARVIGFGLGGVLAMMIAVVAGVWAGVSGALGRKEAVQHAPFTWWVVNRLLFFAAITSIRTYATYFLKDAFKISYEQALVMTGTLIMFVGIFTVISAIPSGWLSDRIGPRRLTAWSGILAAAGTAVLMTSIFAPNLVTIYAAGVMLGLSAGFFTTTNWALGTNLVPPEEAGRYLGISNLAGAGAGIVGTGIGGPIADILNQYRPGLGYFVLFGGYGILFLLSTLSLRGLSIRKGGQAAAGEALSAVQ